MRICQIITRLIVGGAQENTLLTCEGLQERGHDVLLLAGPECGPEGSLWDRARTGGYTAEKVDSLIRAVSPPVDWRCRRQLLDRITEFSPDLVHTHSSKAGILGRWAASRAHVPVIAHTIHGLSFNRTQNWLWRRVFHAAEVVCSRRTNCIITVADAMTEQAVAARLASRDKFVTVYSGVQTPLFDPRRYSPQIARQRWGFHDDAVVAGTVARLQANKGFEQLIPIAGDLIRRNPNMRFVWVGDGPRRNKYEKMLDRAGLRQHIHLTGLIPPEDIPANLAGMDLLVHLSRWEGLPRAMVQASLMGLPVVGYDIDGAREAVEDGQTGLLAPLDDKATIKRHIAELAHHPNMRHAYGQAGREKCLVRFDHRVMIDRLDELFRTLVAKA